MNAEDQMINLIPKPDIPTKEDLRQDFKLKIRKAMQMMKLYEDLGIVPVVSPAEKRLQCLLDRYAALDNHPNRFPFYKYQCRRIE